MVKNQDFSVIIEIPNNEEETFDKLIKSCRSKHIRTSQEIVDKIFKEQPVYLQNIKKGDVSKSILGLRELVWNEYLKYEVNFNIILMKELHTTLKTPKHIFQILVVMNRGEIKQS